MLPAKQKQQRVYELLRDRIITCKMPPGAIISEDVLSQEFGSSRTPVREALLRLQRENLVTIYPRKGTFVAAISKREIDDIHEIRLLIEPETAAAVCSRLERDKLLHFGELLGSQDAERLTPLAIYQNDRAFHTWIMEASGNQTLVQFYANIMDRSQRVRILSGTLPYRAESSRREHVSLIEALDAQDGERVRSLMAEHIRSAWDVSLRLLSLFNGEAVERAKA